MFFKYFIITILLFFVTNTTFAQENIQNFNSEIQIEYNGDITVSETITVRAEGKKIKRGIYRDLPLTRKNSDGKQTKIRYKMLSIKRDGIKENYFKKRVNNYQRFYIGEEGYFLPTGKSYTYQIKYKIPKQIFYFESYDELYWNITGNDWSFKIDKVRAIIKPPSNIPIENYKVFMGILGNTSAENTNSFIRNNNLYIKTMQPLMPQQGLSVVTTFAKNQFEYPSLLKQFFIKYSGLLILLTGIGICGIYYNQVWNKYGKDPRSRGVAPFYDAPKGISPAWAYTITKMGSIAPKKLLTIIIISLASKGYLILEENSKEDFIIRKTNKINNKNELSEEENVVLNNLSHSTDLSPSNTKLISLVSFVVQVIKGERTKDFYALNTKYWAIGLIPYFATFGILFWTGHISPDDLRNLAVVMVGTFFILIIGSVIYKVIFMIKQASLLGKVMRVSLVILICCFGAFSFYKIVLENMDNLIFSFYTFLSIMFIAWMYHLLKAPTVKGQEIIDHLNGLKLYMEKVEEPILKRFDPPQMSRQLFEEYLPYAVALDVEGKWAEAFEKHVIASTSTQSKQTSPSWYRGNSSSKHAINILSTAALINQLDLR